VQRCLHAGLLLRLSIWQQPQGLQIFDDASYWTLPEEGFPSAGVENRVEKNENQTVHGSNSWKGFCPLKCVSE